VVPIDGTVPIVNFDGEPTPVCLPYLDVSQSHDDEFAPLVVVELPEYLVSILKGFVTSLHALVEGSFVPGLCIFYGFPY